jgi:hypothetical protein
MASLRLDFIDTASVIDCTCISNAYKIFGCLRSMKHRSFPIHDSIFMNRKAAW